MQVEVSTSADGLCCREEMNVVDTEEKFRKLAGSIEGGDIESVERLCEVLLEKGFEAHEIVQKGMSPGMDVVGIKFDEGTYFLPNVLMAAEAMKAGLRILEPHIKEDQIGGRGVVAIGTIMGDIHDIGKNLVASTLSASGYRVIDLGNDVPPEEFIQSCSRDDARLVAMSSLITTTMINMKDVIALLEEDNMRQMVRVLIGGAPVSDQFCQRIGADAMGHNAKEGVAKANELMEGE